MYYVLSNPQVTNAQVWFNNFELGEALIKMKFLYINFIRAGIIHLILLAC